MQSTYARDVPAASRVTRRAQVISLLGPLVVAAGFVWAIVQPYRITLLHPHHQGFWWLAIEPPLLVVLAGLLFAVVIARPLLMDLEELGGHGTAR